MNYQKFKALFSAALFSLMCQQGYGAAKYDEVGTVDRVYAEGVVISDEVYGLSKLTNCYDKNGRKDIGCYGLKKAQWAGLVLDRQSVGTMMIKSVYILSEGQYKALVND